MRLINADALKKQFSNNSYGMAAKSIIDDAPTVEAIPGVRAQKVAIYRPFWVQKLTIEYDRIVDAGHFVDDVVYYCSACKKRLCSRFTNYCPSCGAKMHESEDNHA